MRRNRGDRSPHRFKTTLSAGFLTEPSNPGSFLMLFGSCLCGAVAYEVDAAPGPIVHCHCRTCRKTHGSAFSTVSPAPREKFRFVRGEDLLGAFESSPGKWRKFCTRCGSHIVADRPDQPVVLLRLGCLDTKIDARPKLHIWRSDGADWYDPKDQLPERAEGR